MLKDLVLNFTFNYRKKLLTAYAPDIWVASSNLTCSPGSASAKEWTFVHPTVYSGHGRPSLLHENAKCDNILHLGENHNNKYIVSRNL